MKPRFTDDSWRKEPWFRQLCASLLRCGNETDLANVLRDIGTLSELQAWAERLEVARLLAQGLSYRKVAAMTGASTTTVTRVARSIENGTGGYRKILNVHRHHRLVPKESLVQDLEETSTVTLPPPSSVLQKYLHKKS